LKYLLFEFWPSWKLFLFSAIILRVLLIQYPCSVGEDMGQQVFSSKQWIHGETRLPNLLTSPDPEDLSKDQSIWILRPPGGSWISLPGLLLGFSLGASIQIILFLFGLVSGLGWLRIARLLSLPSPLIRFLALLLALIATVNSLKLSTGSVVAWATFPWLLIGAIQFANQWKNQNVSKITQICFPVFFLFLGCHAFFKLSSLLTLTAVASLPFLILISFKGKKITRIFSKVFISGLLFILPYLWISKFNERMSGISSDELYSRQDFNAQHELWGHFFEESTRGSVLAASLVASVGYASPTQMFSNKFRDFLLQFESYTELMESSGINPRILACCIFSIPFTFVIFTMIITSRRSVGLTGFFLSLSLATIPFLGLAVVSFHHKYNYLIYHSYTKEFGVIFILISLIYLSRSEKTSNPNLFKRFLKFLILGGFVALPLIYNVKIYSSLITDVFDQVPISTYEQQQRFGPSKFSNSLQLISEDTNSSLDLCFFLCSGDQADHCLRTQMRSLSVHFAKDNLNKYHRLQSSKPLIIYCLMDKSLANDIDFVNNLKGKFPNNSKISKFDPTTIKIQLNSKS